jgi:formate hydrogenlyase transcriptional activator
MTPESVRARYELLLEVSHFIVTHRDLGGLLRALRFSLQRLVAFDGISLTLFDPDKRTIRLLVVDAMVPHVPTELELPLEETPAALAMETMQPFYLPDITQETRFPKLCARLETVGVRSAAMFPLFAAQRFFGTLNFGALRVNAYAPDDLEFMRQVASQVSVAVENVLNYESAAAYQDKLAKERDRLQLLLEVNNAVMQQLETRELFRTVAACVRRVLAVEMTAITLRDEEAQLMRAFVIDYPGGLDFLEEGAGIDYARSPASWALDAGKPMVFEKDKLGSVDNPLLNRFLAEGFVCGCVVPLICRGRGLGTINALSRREKAFSPEAVELLTQVGAQVAIALDNSLAYRRIAELNAKLSEEKLYLEDEIREQYEEIVGRSAALNAVLKQTETIAPLDSTVLLTGETGTGKEVIARAIHNRSARRDRTFVKVNCASIPGGLLESELFGHEKGAFTGAIAARVGRFELADRGTLFLDEVGEIPLELQPKLLRVLQENEFERLGSSRTRRVDVRVVAATNRDLKEMVQNKEFRADLYYRLNVFPIQVPPLRERREDIPMLVRYFAQVHAHRLGKPISTIPSEAMEKLERYPWPGNVRELQNLIERSVILSPGPVLRVPLDELRGAEVPALNGAARTLEEADRKHIIEALEATGWVLAGQHGAAARLGLKRSTLQFRMAKLGIKRPRLAR